MATPLSPLAMLATSMHAQPGVYALLLGSGVSTGAGMPTGWGVVRDLVRKVAAQEDPGTVDDAHADPEEWWRAHHGEDLGYSSLLDSLAPTAAARQGLLAGYFEPTEEERGEGVKIPSKAHRAIAQLVKQGYIKVIITTNFDRLIEQALEAEGVAPQVISRPEAVAGMQPLPHASSTVIKLHGDYKDQGSLNTADELASYPDQWTSLLERVLDEYGLVISGWSADWDTALVSVMEASPNRRYPLYWDSLSSKGDTAKRLISSRSGKVLTAPGADELFAEVLSNVDALVRLTEPPLTTAMAVARLKRYLPDPLHRIDLHDLLMAEVDRVAEGVASQPVSLPSGADAQWLESLYGKHLDAARPLLKLLAVGVWHDDHLQHQRLWADVLQRLIDAGTRRIGACTSGLDLARLYPALLASSVMGLVAVHRGREDLVLALAEVPRGRGRMGAGEPVVAGTLLHPQSVIMESWAKAFPRWSGTQWMAPASHLLREDLRETLRDPVPSDDDYQALFSSYEYRLALIHIKQGEYPLHGEWMGDRAFGWNRSDAPHLETAFKELGNRRDESWPWRAYFGSSAELDRAYTQLREVMTRNRWA